MAPLRALSPTLFAHHTAFGRAVVESDPLDADGIVRTVPECNARADTASLTTLLRDLTARAHRIGDDPVAAAAGLRDIGLLLGSLRRHGVEPDLDSPTTATLRRLGVTSGMVPRDTVQHYGPWNPSGHRERSYTGTPGESALIQSVRHAVPALYNALDHMILLRSVDPTSPVFATVAGWTEAALHDVVAALRQVRHDLPPDVFAHDLRPYFDGVRIDGRLYLGPAAAQMPMFLVDHLLWSCDDPAEPAHRTFQLEMVEYGTPWARRAFHDADAGPSIVSTVLLAVASQGEAAVRSSVEALRKVVRALVVFRGSHLAYARRSYDSETRLFERGSGGATVSLLREILDYTRGQATRVSDGVVPVG